MVARRIRIGATSYTGPGDVVSGAYAWHGLRAYSFAAAGANAVRIIRASDSTQQNFVTLSDGSLDVASIATFLTSTTGKVVTIFDQTGNGYDLTQATDANRPTFTLNAIGSLPGITFASGQGLADGVAHTAQSQPISCSAVAKRTGAFTTQADILQAAGGDIQLLFASSTNTVGLYAGSAVGTATASDSAFHAINALVNGASSSLNVDGSGTGVSPGTSGFRAGGPGALYAFYMGDDGTAGGNPLTGVVTEGGWWAGDKSASFSALSANQQSYWGF